MVTPSYVSVFMVLAKAVGPSDCRRQAAVAHVVKVMFIVAFGFANSITHPVKVAVHHFLVFALNDVRLFAIN